MITFRRLPDGNLKTTYDFSLEEEQELAREIETLKKKRMRMAQSAAPGAPAASEPLKTQTEKTKIPSSAPKATSK